MSSPDGKPVYFPVVPWKEEKTVSCGRTECTCGDPVWVDAAGNYVNEDGEPLNERDWDNGPPEAA